MYTFTLYIYIYVYIYTDIYRYIYICICIHISTNIPERGSNITGRGFEIFSDSFCPALSHEVFVARFICF